ncbi:MAG: serine/threonine protein kinase [Deltaproteobacteria bacterium]|nr:serine/threonine protein kinase [Deltaproteobacteria bacterium]
MQLGRFEVIRSLGSGGMSEALLARAPSGRQVVLKRPRQRDPDLIARLRDEGRLGAKLFHPNLVETIEAFEHDGLPVLALGFVEGPTIDALRKQRALPPASVARVGCQIAEALGCIHGALGDDGRPLSAVHRDVSPRNIIVTPTGDAVLIDLGIARFDELRGAQTETGMVLGTLRYMAPELIDGERASPASDFYSLGCVLIEAATGENCFTGPPSEVAAAIVAKGPLAGAAAGRIEQRLKELLSRMCARDPKQRFHEAHEASRALRELEAALGGGQGPLARSIADAAAAAAAAADNPFAAAAAVPKAVTGINPPQAGAGAAIPSDTVPLPPAPSPSVMLTPPRAPLPGPSAFQPQRIDGTLDLAIEPRSTRQHVPQQEYSSPERHRPTYKKDSAILATALKVLLVVLAVAGAYGWWRYQSDADARASAAAAERKLEEQAERLRQAMQETAEPCERRGDAYWVYTDDKGTDVVVQSVQQVPKRLRAKARCVTPTH